MIITIPLTKDLKRFLSWWTVHPMVTSGRPFQESHPMATVMTDVSLSGWGRLGRSIWAQVCGKQRKEIEIERSRNNRSSTSGKTERTGIFPVQPSQGLVPTALGRSLFPSIFERPCIDLLVTADNARFSTKLLWYLAGREALVPSALGSQCSWSFWSNDRFGPPNRELCSLRSRDSAGATTGRSASLYLDYVRRNSQAGGVSPQVAERVASPRRSATARSYDGRLAKFRSWAEENSCSPMNASIDQVSAFLMLLFGEGKQISTIEICRLTRGSTRTGFRRPYEGGVKQRYPPSSAGYVYQETPA